MAESTVVRNKRDAQIVINGTAGTYPVAYETGDFSFDVPAQTVSLYLDRGSIGTTPSIRDVDDQPVTFSFSAHLRDIGDSAWHTLLDLCAQYSTGGYSSNMTSTISTSSDTKTYTVTWTVDGTAFGEADKSLAFYYSVIRASVSEGDPDTINVTGTSYQLRPARL